MADLAIEVPPTVALVAKVQPKPGKLPTYASWKSLNDVKILDIFCGSSFVGHSSAKIGLVTGAPGKQVNVEDARKLLAFGDRVALGLKRSSGSVDWQFCGYVLQSQISIDVSAEHVVWKLAGPEFWWGDGSAASGCGSVVRGQFRRTSVGNDAWQAKTTTVTRYEDWELFTDEHATFNPEGKKNMTRDDVMLSPHGRKPQIKGKLWEVPDRRIASVDVALAWNMRDATKTIVEQYGDVEFSGVTPPDWSTVPMEIADKMRETNIDAVGCWEALKRILGNKYGFFVDPRPSRPDGKPVNVNGKGWGPFQIHFFKRTDSNPANLWLNPHGTPMRSAKASVSRLELASDVSRSPNRVIVNGGYVRALKLVYWGGRTPKLTKELKPTALQNGWHATEGLLSDYCKAGSFVIDDMFAGVSAARRTEWLDRFHAKGKDHLKYWNVFRRFVWNEAGELDQTKNAQYRSVSIKWYAPDLKGIADTPEKAGIWYRRRRKMQDTLFLRNATVSQWDRHPPTLWMAAAPTYNGAEWATLKWRRITDQHFILDSDRCAITFTADDLAEWRPFDKQDSPETDTAQKWPDDPRTFASLLHEGVLRLCVECSVPVDFGMTCVAEPTAIAGAPFPREVYIPAEKNFVTSLPYTADGLTQTPSGLTPATVDGRADAQRQADITRDSSQDESIHASIMTSGDWERQTIGSRIKKIKGRDIDLSGKSGAGAQIVAIRLDTNSYQYELLTESLALALKDRDRELLDKKAQVYKNAKRPTRIPNQP